MDTRACWQKMYDLSKSVIDSYAYDLVHDAKWIKDHGETTRVFYWSVGECGTHIGTDPTWVKCESYAKYTHYRVVASYNKFEAPTFTPVSALRLLQATEEASQGAA